MFIMILCPGAERTSPALTAAKPTEAEVVEILLGLGVLPVCRDAEIVEILSGRDEAVEILSGREGPSTCRCCLFG